jgi:hypothetical protein
MAISFGLKSPMDYSVYSASGAAVLLALHAFRQETAKSVLNNGRDSNRHDPTVEIYRDHRGPVYHSPSGCHEIPARGQNDEELLRARDSVWHARFAGDTRTLQALVPPEAIVMSGVCDVVFVLLLEQESLFLA